MQLPRTRSGLFALLILALAAGLLAAEDATVVGGDLGAALDRAVQRTTGGGFWGVVLVASEGEVILAKGYGFADYEVRQNTPRTLFELASTSKPFTAAAVLRLAQDGKLRLEDPLKRFFKRAPADKRGITVHQLLTHTSGLSPEVGLPYASRATREELVRQVLAAPLDSKPGEKFAYCNFGYALLAAIVEVASGKPYEEYLRAKLFEPAGLVDTGFIRDETLDAGRVTRRLSERTPDATAVDWFWGWGYRGMGGVVSTAYDLLRWDRALRTDKILDEATRAKSYEPALAGYACGWRVSTTPRGTRKVEHSGGVEGYAINYVRHLEDDAVVIVLSNGKSDLHGVTKALEELLIPPPRIAASFDVGPFELSKHNAAEFSGTADLKVSRASGEIRLVLEERKRRHAVVTVRLPVGAARKLRDDLAQLAGKTRGGKSRMDAGAYLVGYTLRDGRLELSDGLELQVMPRYVGRGEGGKRIVDERVTLVVVDTKRRQWPLMAKMDAKAVRALVKDLEKALEPN